MIRYQWFALAVILTILGCEKAKTSPQGVGVTVSKPSSTFAVAQPDTPPTQPPGDATRRAATWVLSQGGSLIIEHEMKSRPVAEARDLPAGEFKILQIHLAGRDQVSDANLALLDGLPHLEALNLNKTKVTAAGLTKLRNLPNLKYLNLCVAGLDDGALAHLAGFPHLESVELSYTAVTDAGLSHLSKLSKLRTVYLSNTSVTDEGIKTLQQAAPRLEVKR